MSAPVLMTWEGDGMRPSTPAAARAADRQFVIGERYRLVVEEERSTKTHNHEFAWLQAAWETLPERLADMFPSAEHLRKRALIDAGWFDEQSVDAGSNAAAIRFARFIGSREEHSVAVVRGSIVVVRTAKSQSRRAMNRQDFQASKEAIMRVVADMLGASVDDVRSAA